MGNRCWVCGMRDAGYEMQVARPLCIAYLASRISHPAMYQRFDEAGATISPITSLVSTSPNTRLSSDTSVLSPTTKHFPLGIARRTREGVHFERTGTCSVESRRRCESIFG